MSNNIINLDLLSQPTKIIKLAGKSITYKEMKINKAMKAQTMWIDATGMLANRIKKLKKEYKETIDTFSDTDLSILALNDRKFEKKYTAKIIDICLFVIKPQIKLSSLLSWLKLLWLNKAWLKENCNVKQLNQFVEQVMIDLLGEKAKKKIEEVKKLVAQ